MPDSDSPTCQECWVSTQPATFDIGLQKSCTVASKSNLVPMEWWAKGGLNLNCGDCHALGFKGVVMPYVGAMPVLQFLIPWLQTTVPCLSFPCLNLPFETQWQLGTTRGGEVAVMVGVVGMPVFGW